MLNTLTLGMFQSSTALKMEGQILCCDLLIEIMKTELFK